MTKKLSLAMAIGFSFASASSYALDCSDRAEWGNAEVYVGSAKIQNQSKAYTAKWWTRGQNPAANSGAYDVWKLDGLCGSAGDASGGDTSIDDNKPIIGDNNPTEPDDDATDDGGTDGGTSSQCDAPAYVVGEQYRAGDQVENSGSVFQCNIGGWCSSTGAWAYAPGTGLYWQSAWQQLASCDSGTEVDDIGDIGDIGDVGDVGDVDGGGEVVDAGTGDTPGNDPSGGNTNDDDRDSALPKHALVGYWHNFNNGSGLYRIADVPDTWDVIVVAFADDGGNGSVTFNLDRGLNKTQFIADIAAKQAQGKIVVLSFGGQNGTVTLNNDTNLANFVSSTAAILDEYGFDGIDIDLESGANVTHGAPVIQYLIEAVKQLDAAYPDFYLSMAPEHPYVQGGYIAYSGIWGAYLPLIDGVREELDLLHVQLYNNGGLSTPYQASPYAAGSVDMMVASARMLIEGFPLAGGSAVFFDPLRADQVALGLPSGPAAAGYGHASLADINSAVACITLGTQCGALDAGGVYPTFRGVMTWSINWDMHDGGSFSNVVGGHTHNLP